MDTIYKIRRPDGLFSTGGAYPGFNKKGKIWRQKGHITNHLNQVSRSGAYTGAVIVTYEIVETEVDSQPVTDYIDDIRQRRAAEEQRKAEARRSREDLADRALYEQLHKRFGE
jgi:hypothetical protein